MAKKILKTVGEGGAHAHKIPTGKIETAKDGKHKHIFFINNRLLMTELDGMHSHLLDIPENVVGVEKEKHIHSVSIRTQEGQHSFQTKSGDTHAHELQSGMTTLSGVHRHQVSLMGENYISIIPSDLMEQLMEKISIKSDSPLETDFSLIKRLNKEMLQDNVEKSVVASIIKRMTTLSEGLRIESLILSKERFADVGIATRFVLDQGLDIKSSNVLAEQGIFTFQIMSRDAFEEITLVRIRITEGVEAVIGFLAEKEEPQTANTVASGTINEMTDIQQKGMLVNWSNEKIIAGTMQEVIADIAKQFEIKRKFVTIEQPRTSLIKLVEETMEVQHAVYSDLAESYKSMAFSHSKSETMDAVTITVGCSEQLIFFFDDEEEMVQFLNNNQKLDYEPGVYTVKETMFGYCLLPVHVTDSEEPIFDSNIIENLKTDTETFFEKRQFYIDNNIKHKRGIFLIGPPGNGKTTFIKNYLLNSVNKNRFGIMIDCSKRFDVDIQEFLIEVTKDRERIVCLEDVDSVAENEYQRAGFLNFIDGAGSMDKTLFIATSNHPEKLDEAILKRPSRFDKKYIIDLPSLKMREEFLKRFFPELSQEQLEDYAEKTEGFSGAYFKELFLLKNLQEITIDEAVEKLHEQINMVFKSQKKNILKSVEVVLFEDLSGMERLKAKFDKTMNAYSIEEKACGKRPKKEETVPDGKKKPKKIKSIKLNFEIVQKNLEKRLVTGPVLIPENIDLQDDIISSEEIERAAHNYMVKLAFKDDVEFLKSLGFKSNRSERGFQHLEFNRKIAVVETFVAPVDMVINGRTVKQGTWVMTVKVFDDEIWNMVKLGKITGFSIGGRARTKPEKIED